ncbi:MAG: CDP-diacylglycerol--glycerol-3-phosphate 3-phosphatidyltransferase [Planctomycetales bacterium]|nr:CDP-diacylglycerol--glycerol-3-phosphate 3-phosphatidyltransferase [Planctomycetales bacterium]
MALNLPNQITVARLVISVLLFVFMSIDRFTPSLVCFALAAGTDWIDGYIARKYKLVTQLGRILDPFADKVLICGIFIFLAAEPNSQILPWMTVVIVGRELLVTALRSFLEQQGGDFSAKMAGKLKMVFQCAAAILSLLVLIQRENVNDTLQLATVVTVWLAVASTVYSGLGYVITAAKMIKAQA